MSKKKMLLIIIPIVLLVIIGATFAILFFATDTFKSGKELFARYFVQNTQMLDLLSDENMKAQDEFKASNSYTSNGELDVAIQASNVSTNIKAVTASKHDSNTGKTYADVTLKNGEADLLKASYINSGDIYAVRCDDIVPAYIGVRNSNLKAAAKNWGLTEAEVANIPDTIKFDEIFKGLKIKDEQKQHIIDTYLNVIYNSIPNDKYKKLGKTNVSVDNVTYEVKGYSVEIDANTMGQILINCLNTLKNDNTTLVIISNELSALGFEEYKDITKISGVIDTFTQGLQSQEIGEDVTITVYENNKKMVKTVIESAKGEKTEIDRVNKDGNDKFIITTTMEDKLGNIAEELNATERNLNTSYDGQTTNEPVQATDDTMATGTNETNPGETVGPTEEQAIQQPTSSVTTSQVVIESTNTRRVKCNK